jgi:plastocyanin
MRLASRTMLATAAAVSLSVLMSGMTAAQSADTGGDVIEVRAVEYAFTGLPTSVPVGTSLAFVDAGAEVHEMIVVRIADDVTATVDELLAMEGDPVEQGLIEMVGQLFAGPGEAAEGTVPLDREGRYVVVCFIPQGLTDMALLEEMMSATGPEDVPDAAQAFMDAIPHALLGMVQEFTVTAPGTTPGPLPSVTPSMAPMADGSMEPEGSSADG